MQQFSPFSTTLSAKTGREDGGDLNQSGSNFTVSGGQISDSQRSRSKSRGPGRLVFLRGFPCAKWLNHLGATLDVDPELFYRHLDVSVGLVPDTSRLDYSYSTPSTSARDIIQLRLCNTGSWDTNGSKPTLALLRKACEASMTNHLEDFIRVRNFATGDSVVRQFMVHDHNNFSIEQKISIEVVRHTSTWSSELALQRHVPAFENCER